MSRSRNFSLKSFNFFQNFLEICHCSKFFWKTVVFNFSVDNFWILKALRGLEQQRIALVPGRTVLCEIQCALRNVWVQGRINLVYCRPRPAPAAERGMVCHSVTIVLYRQSVSRVVDVCIFLYPPFSFFGESPAFLGWCNTALAANTCAHHQRSTGGGRAGTAGTRPGRASLPRRRRHRWLRCHRH